MTMVERRASRADLLRRAVASLQLENCTVLTADVGAVCRRSPARFDVVTARSFAAPATTARFIDVLLAPSGIALISEPPTDRSPQWAATLVGHPMLTDEGVHLGIRRLARRN
jgi:16S rRNA G527 N7-methylase RsmG